jgi:AbrB family looped-hinge helix DNA binding protein
MARTYKMTTRGRVTLPPEIRASLNVGPGDKVDFVIEGDQIVLKGIKVPKQPVSQ